MKKILSIILLTLICGVAMAQENITATTRAFVEKGEDRELKKQDVKTPLLEPLKGLKIDPGWMLMEFRNLPDVKRRMTDNTFMLLSIRPTDVPRPSDDYLNKEYYRVIRSMNAKEPYIAPAGGLTYIDPLKHITIDGSNQSIWQAVLLKQYAWYLFGMRGHANSRQSYMITCQEDTKNALDLVAKREGKDMNTDQGLSPEMQWLRHSLLNISDPQPRIYRGENENVAYVECYVFQEFGGLIKELLQGDEVISMIYKIVRRIENGQA